MSEKILPKDERMSLDEYVRALWEKLGKPPVDLFMHSKWLEPLCVSESMRARVRTIAEGLAKGGNP